MPTEEDIAIGEADATDLPLYRKAGGKVTDPGLSNAGLEMASAPVERGFEDPSLIRILYHAYDGRVVPVPAYMAPKLLANRFPPDHVPEEYAGKRVWHGSATDVFKPGQMMCLLHGEQSKQVKDEMKAAGLSPGMCAKKGMTSMYNLERHMELKHRREWETIKDMRDKSDRNEDRSLQRAQAEAFVKLAETLAGKDK